MENEKFTLLRYDTKAAADFLGCSPSTLKISRVTGRLLGSKAPAYRKIGRKVIYDHETIHSWFNQFQPRNNTAE